MSTMMLPELHLADWRPTKETLHLYAQIVGKIRLATTAPRNHWWNAPLYVDVRGLTTRRLHHHGTTFEIKLDFLDHALLVQTADGRSRAFGLGDGLTVADFDARLHAMLAELGIDVEIREQPFGVPMTTPFPQDTEHASWDQEAIDRFGRILDWSDSVYEEFSGWFNGKTSPVHLFWHGLDLAVTRFSGRPGATLDADPVTQEAYSHEVISFGFWAGDDTVGDATYYSYTSPEPERLRDQPLSVGNWIQYGAGSLAVLPYETVRSAQDPRTTLLAFCQSRLRGRRSPCRLGHQQLRIQMVSDPRAADPAPRHRCRRVRPSQREHLACTAQPRTHSTLPRGRRRWASSRPNAFHFPSRARARARQTARGQGTHPLRSSRRRGAWCRGRGPERL
jgi:hypothetical protein